MGNIKVVSKHIKVEKYISTLFLLSNYLNSSAILRRYVVTASPMDTQWRTSKDIPKK